MPEQKSVDQIVDEEMLKALSAQRQETDKLEKVPTQLVNKLLLDKGITIDQVDKVEREAHKVIKEALELQLTNYSDYKDLFEKGQDGKNKLGRHEARFKQGYLGESIGKAYETFRKVYSETHDLSQSFAQAFDHESFGDMAKTLLGEPITKLSNSWRKAPENVTKYLSKLAGGAKLASDRVAANIGQAMQYIMEYVGSGKKQAPDKYMIQAHFAPKTA